MFVWRSKKKRCLYYDEIAICTYDAGFCVFGDNKSYLYWVNTDVWNMISLYSDMAAIYRDNSAGPHWNFLHQDNRVVYNKVVQCPYDWITIGLRDNTALNRTEMT